MATPPNPNLIAPNGISVARCLVHVALPILFRDYDRAVANEMTQTNAAASTQVRGLRLTLSVIAGSLGFVGPDAIADLRDWMQEQYDLV